MKRLTLATIVFSVLLLGFVAWALRQRSYTALEQSLSNQVFQIDPQARIATESIFDTERSWVAVLEFSIRRILGAKRIASVSMSVHRDVTTVGPLSKFDKLRRVYIDGYVEQQGNMTPLDATELSENESLVAVTLKVPVENMESLRHATRLKYLVLMNRADDIEELLKYRPPLRWLEFSGTEAYVEKVQRDLPNCQVRGFRH